MCSVVSRVCGSSDPAERWEPTSGPSCLIGKQTMKDRISLHYGQEARMPYLEGLDVRIIRSSSGMHPTMCDDEPLWTLS